MKIYFGVYHQDDIQPHQFAFRDHALFKFEFQTPPLHAPIFVVKGTYMIAQTMNNSFFLSNNPSEMNCNIHKMYFLPLHAPLGTQQNSHKFHLYQLWTECNLTTLKRIPKLIRRYR